MPNKMPGLIWIQTVWHADGSPKIFLEKSLFWKKNKYQQTTKNMKIYPVGKQLKNIHRGPDKLSD